MVNNRLKAKVVKNYIWITEFDNGAYALHH